MKKKKLLYAIVSLVILVSALLVHKFLESKKQFEQSIIIEDEYLDDTNVFDEGYSPDLGVQNYSIKCIDYDEDMEPENVYKKSFFDYETQISQAVRFCLTPKKNSDYMITIPKVDGLRVEVWRKNLIRYHNKVSALEVLEQEDNKAQYCYSLEKDETYYIYVINDQENEITCNIGIEQDNWIYAPLGGYAEYGLKRVSYLSRVLLFESRRALLALMGDYDPSIPDPEVETMSEDERQHYARWIVEIIECLAGTQSEETIDFERYYRDLDETELGQDLMHSDFNIKFTTSLSGHMYRINHEEWNQHNYFSKYLNSKRASKYIAFSSIPSEDALCNDEIEWVKYIK